MTKQKSFTLGLWIRPDPGSNISQVAQDVVEFIKAYSYDGIVGVLTFNGVCIDLLEETTAEDIEMAYFRSFKNRKGI